MIQTGELILERGDLLDLVVDHFDVFRDFLSGIENLLRVNGRVIDDPLRANLGGAERRERGGDEDDFFHVSFLLSAGVACYSSMRRYLVVGWKITPSIS